jgi:hypothetical protein
MIAAIRVKAEEYFERALLIARQQQDPAATG